MPKKGKDPFRVLVRDYMKMEAEKDDRTHGFLDGAIRTREAERMDERFVEAMKLIVPLLTNAEYQAVAACGMIISTVQSQELRQGYAAQMMDEVRHAQLEMAPAPLVREELPRPRGLRHRPEGRCSSTRPASCPSASSSTSTSATRWTA